MTTNEYFLVFFLFALGFFFIVALLGTERPLRSLAGALPMGCCLWAACTFSSAVLPLFPKDIHGYALPTTLILTGVLLLSSLFVVWRRGQLVQRNTLLFFGFFILVAALHWFFTQLNISIITGDSLRHIHPHAGIEAMKSGRAFNQTLAVLAGLAGQDRYFFSFHSLFSISLLLIMGECIFHEVKSNHNGLLPALSAAIAGPLLLASTHMAAIQTFYANNHMLMATLVAFALSVLLGQSSHPKQPQLPFAKAALGVVTASFLCLLRLEGQLVAILLLVIMLGRPGVERFVRRGSFILFALLTSPCLFFMIHISKENGKVAAANFVIMLLVTLLLPFFFAIKRPNWLVHLQEHANKYTLLGFGLLVAVLLYLRLDRMLIRLGWVVHNAFDESHWGFAHQTLFLALIILLVARFLHRDQEPNTNRRRIDILLYFSIASLLSIVFLTYFHGARLGWSSSQNRMLFHFFPAIILWVSIQAGFGLTVKGHRAPHLNQEGHPPEQEMKKQVSVANTRI